MLFPMCPTCTGGDRTRESRVTFPFTASTGHPTFQVLRKTLEVKHVLFMSIRGAAYVKKLPSAPGFGFCPDLCSFAIPLGNSLFKFSIEEETELIDVSRIEPGSPYANTGVHK